MKKRIEPTHFIEQYNVIDSYKRLEGRRESFGLMQDIEALQRNLDYTKDRGHVIHTVAVWKIRCKK